MIHDENDKLRMEDMGQFVSGFSKILGTSEVGQYTGMIGGGQKVCVFTSFQLEHLLRRSQSR